MNKRKILSNIFSLLLVIIIPIVSLNIVFAKTNIIIPSNTTSLKNKTSSIVDENNKNYDGIIVKYKDGTINKSSIDATITSNGLELQEEITGKGISLLKIKDKNSSIDKIIKNLKSDGNFKVVQPNYLYSIDSIDSNDTYKDNLWGLYNFGQNIESQAGTIGKDISFDKTIKIFSGSTYLGSPGQTIAIIDSGVAYNHPDLINRMWDGTNCKDENGNNLGGCIHGYDFYDNDKNPQGEYESHGTHIAGIISGQMNNGIGGIGVNPNSKIMAIRTGEESFSTVAIIKGIYFAKENGVKIINASFGYNGGTYGVDGLLYDSIKSFTDAGGLFIAASGNNGYNTDVLSNRFFPAAFKTTNYTDSLGYLTGAYVSGGYIFTGITNMISVAASDNQDNKASFSNYGIETVDIGAPGKSIYSSVLGTINLFNQNLTGNTLSLATGGINFNWGIDGYGYLRGDLNSPYGTGTESYIEKQVDISSVNAPSLNFSLWCDAGSSLPGLDDYSTDYLKLSFSTGGTFSDYAKYNYTSSTLPYYTSGGYYNNFSIPIKNYKSSNFKFRFTWHTDDISDTDNGCFIYNSLKIDGKDNGELNTYEYKNGTSMATPYVAGLTSLLWSYKPTLTGLDIKNAILLNGDDVLSMSGTTTTGKRINSYKSILSLMTLGNISGFKGYTNTGKTQQLSTGVITSTRNPYFEWSDDVGQEALSGYILNMSDQSGTIFPTVTTKNKFYTGFIIPADGIYNFSVYEELLNGNTGSVINSGDFSFDITGPNKLTNLDYPTLINKLNYQNFYITGSGDSIDSGSLIELTLSGVNLSKTFSGFLQGESFSFSGINTTTIND
ncbi:MAG: S8 family serine peptidase, partial [Candidatus Gracilibacteria bacterium]|nr:S8 family serine peptidase [Candidatus Gracilibacteria bacterium]